MQQDDKQVHKIFYVLNNFNRSKLPSDQFINWKKKIEGAKYITNKLKKNITNILITLNMKRM